MVKASEILKKLPEIEVMSEFEKALASGKFNVVDVGLAEEVENYSEE